LILTSPTQLLQRSHNFPPLLHANILHSISMADSNRNADLHSTVSATEYFGLHPDLGFTAEDEAVIMQEVNASMNRWDTIEQLSPKAGAPTSMLTESNCGERNDHSFANWCLTHSLQIRLLSPRRIWREKTTLPGRHTLTYTPVNYPAPWSTRRPAL
jgi:hypothetical protein